MEKVTMSTTATSAESGYKGASFVFDSYAYVRRLRDAGMDEQQAAIQAETFMALAEDRLATKQDVAELKRDIAESNVRIATDVAELKRDIAESNVRIATVEASLKRDIEATKAELKRDIETTKAELKRDIETTKAELKRDIETTKAELQKDIALARVTTIQWTAGMFAAQTALIIGAMFAVMRTNQPPAQPPVYQPPAQEMRLPLPPPALSAPPSAPTAPTR
ncbi:MAG: DUF1640 domain-containing protein [Magnetococcales bacterium]|nr:DUF1640 domain-containing protein [Magnetococcales bacterium]